MIWDYITIENGIIDRLKKEWVLKGCLSLYPSVMLVSPEGEVDTSVDYMFLDRLIQKGVVKGFKPDGQYLIYKLVNLEG